MLAHTYILYAIYNIYGKYKTITMPIKCFSDNFKPYQLSVFFYYPVQIIPIKRQET
jgi:hypothetical protein